MAIRFRLGFGVDLVVYKQIEYFCFRGYEVFLAVADKDNTFNEKIDKFLEIGQLHIYNYHNTTDLIKYIENQYIDILIAHTPPFFKIFHQNYQHRLKNKLKIFYDHGEPPAELFSDKGDRIVLRNEKILNSKNADLVISISEFIKKDSALENTIVNIQGYDHLLQEKSNLLLNYGKFRTNNNLGNKFIIINITRFQKNERQYKGIDKFIRLKKLFKLIFPELEKDVEFIIIGKSDPDDVKYVEENGLRAISNLSDEGLIQAYTDSDLYISTSQWEGFNLGIAQALSFGLDTIAVDKGAHNEFPIFTSNDLKAISNKIAEFIKIKSIFPILNHPFKKIFNRNIITWKESLQKLENIFLASIYNKLYMNRFNDKNQEYNIDNLLYNYSIEKRIDLGTLSLDHILENKKWELKLHEVSKFSNKNNKEVDLSIIILNKDQYSFLKNCIYSIQKRIKNIKYEILIADTGSTDFDVLKFYYNNECRIEFHGFYNFSVNNNVSVKKAQGKYILLLNNDTEILDADIRSIIEFYEKNIKIGAIGFNLIYEDQTIQHAGVRICPDNPFRYIPEHIEKNKNIGEYHKKIRQVPAVTGACFFISKSLYFEIGGLDAIYQEEAQDIDLCMRLWNKGYSNYIHPGVLSYHYENKSRTVKESQHDRNIFIEKHKDFIDNFVFPWQITHSMQ